MRAYGHILRHCRSQEETVEPWRVMILVHVQDLEDKRGQRGQGGRSLVRGFDRQVVELLLFVIQLFFNPKGARNLVDDEVVADGQFVGIRLQ